MKKRVFEIKVPATTANLGPGFDSLGLAMRIYNRVTVTVGGEEGMEIEGFGADELPRDESNLMVKSAMALAEREGRALPAMHWKAQHDIPLARGMGSSSAAIVAGLMAADAALGLRTSRGVLTHLAADIEGHPDNVAPALVGGLTICMPGSEPMEVVRVRPLEALRLALLVPDYQLSTESMRRVLPREVAFVDAVFNLSRSAAMVAALEHGLWTTLKEACRDRLHQPQRMELMGGMKAIFAAAYEAGAHGVAVSGSGPTAVAFCTDRAEEVAQAMLEAAKGAGVDAETRVTQPDLDGATVTQRE
jgi:homoserine kinase